MLPPAKALRVAIFSLILAVLLCVAPMPPAQASIHTYPLEDGVMLRSLQALRDNRDRGWQVVLFANIKDNQITQVHLRMAGFPGTVVQRSTPLRVQQGATQWELPDAFGLNVGEDADVDNTGEYDARELWRSLERSRPITLTLSLAAGDVEVVLPPFAVKEWLKLREEAL